MKDVLNFLGTNWAIIAAILVCIINRKKISPALFGDDGKMDFQELVKATVWGAFVILMLQALTSENYQLDLELLKILLLYMVAMGGFKFGKDWIDKAYNKKDTPNNS